MKTWFLSVAMTGISLVCLSGGQACFAGAEESVEDFLSKPDAVQIIRNSRRQQIQSFLKVLQHQNTGNPIRRQAVDILGEMRAEEAVDVLIENIDMITAETVKERALETLYPCVRALVKIGKPSSKSTLDKLAEEMSGTKRLLLVTVLREIEGMEVAQFTIDKSISISTNTRSTENLRKSSLIISGQQ